MWNQTRNLVGKTIGLLWGLFYCHWKPIVLPPWFNLQIQTSTCGRTFLFGTFMQKTRVYHFFKFDPTSWPPYCSRHLLVQRSFFDAFALIMSMLINELQLYSITKKTLNFKVLKLMLELCWSKWSIISIQWIPNNMAVLIIRVLV